MNIIDELNTEGSRGVNDLCGLCQDLGYRGVSGKLGDLEEFLADNPGAIEAVYNWVRENYAKKLEEMAEELEEEDEDPESLYTIED